MDTVRRWDIFCKVVDNFGDIGVCWRLCCDLAARSQLVRLWIDDTSALAWMAPAGCPGVEVIDCKNGLPTDTEHQLGDVLVDTFGCEFAIDLIAAKSTNTPATAKNVTSIKPIWLNLEYLTAESFAQRNHTLPYTHHTGPAAGWTQRYFYPGFHAKTGGLLRESNLLQRQQDFDRVAWLHQLNLDLAVQPQDPNPFSQFTLFISLFCYEPAALSQLLDQLANPANPAKATQHSHLLVTHGRAAQAVKAVLEHKNRHEPAWNKRGLLSISYLPTLTQTDYDHLLWACDLNFVRGEDSLVRAIWAGKPFVWQIYPQSDDAHHAKLNAFLDTLDADPSLRRFHETWNGMDTPATNLDLPQPDLPLWAQKCQALRQNLLKQDDLVTQLLAYIAFLNKNR